jgi:hypothetical protein
MAFGLHSVGHDVLCYGLNKEGSGHTTGVLVVCGRKRNPDWLSRHVRGGKPAFYSSRAYSKQAEKILCGFTSAFKFISAISKWVS